MSSVLLCGVDRPGLTEMLVGRGMAVTSCPAGRPRGETAGGDRPTVLVMLATDGCRVPACVAPDWRGGLLLLADCRDDATIAALLDNGADDAVAARASNGLIAARIAALARRLTASERITIGALSIDPVERRVLRDGRPIDLLPREYRLLRYLADQSGRAVGRAELLRAVWGLHFDPGTNVVEVHVSRLRARIDRGFGAPMLRTEKGHGYSLNCIPARADAVPQ